MTAASTGAGASGEVVVQGLASPAQSILIDGAGSGIFTDTQGTGAGGDIHLFANSVTLQNGGTLSASTSGSDVSATGGTITVTAPGQMAMTGGSSISASSSGPANAGDISINAGQQLTMQNSSITTEASQASGGNITIQAVELVGLETSKISASVLGGPQTTGGNITIDPNLVILQNSQITANAVQGNGGNISLTTNFLIVNNTLIGATTPVPASAISASSAIRPERDHHRSVAERPGQRQDHSPLAETAARDVAAQPTLRIVGRRRVQQLHRGGTGQPAHRTGQLARESAGPALEPGPAAARGGQAVKRAGMTMIPRVRRQSCPCGRSHRPGS